MENLLCFRFLSVNILLKLQCLKYSTLRFATKNFASTLLMPTKAVYVYMTKVAKGPHLIHPTEAITATVRFAWIKFPFVDDIMLST